MKRYIFLISLFLASMLSVSTSNAQQLDSLKQKQDSLKQMQIKFFSSVLNTSQDTAKQVATIMDTYKESVKKVIFDVTLSEEARRIKIDELIEAKNKKLVLLLSPAQQEKIIPSTERKKNKPEK